MQCQLGSGRVMDTLRAKPLQWKLDLGMWNVILLAGKKLMLVCETKKYGLDLVILRSTHSTKLLCFPTSYRPHQFQADNLSTVFPSGQRGCLYKVSDVRKENCISVHAPNRVFNLLGGRRAGDKRLPPTDSIVLLDDFSAYIGGM